MKKLLAILFTLLLIAMLPTAALAATGINKYEQEVLNLLDSNVELGVKDWGYEIPQEYINTAKNYFAGDCDMTEEEKDAVIGYIKTGIEVVKKEAEEKKSMGAKFNLSTMSEKARTEVLDMGKKACAEVDLQLTYDSKDHHVVITEKDSSTPVFESSAVIKATGQAITFDAAFVGTAVLVCMVLGAAVMLFVSKKNGLFSK